MRKLILLFFLFVIFIQESSLAAAPFAVPTFECLGIYWSPSSTDSLGCQVKYRKQGDANWKQGINLFYFNRTDAASYIGGKYRGSIVNLTPNTTYEISLRLSSGSDSATFTAKTWDEIFPVASTITLPVTSSSMLNITQSGTANGYILYAPATGSTATIDVNSNADQCINVNASYIIIRGVTLKNGRINGITLGSVHDVVIEQSDISGWGRIGSPYGMGVDLDGAIYSQSTSLTRIIVQRTKMHHPRSDANSWQEPVSNTHPQGPQTICFIESDGNHVFRYNEVYSDSAHKYNDAFGGGWNSSFKGFPNKDTDVYGNYLSFEWDDAIEMEGADRNVRVWGNYIDTFACGITSAGISIGPYYVWRNVLGRSQWGPNGSLQTGSYPDGGPGEFFKAGNASNYMGGKVYLFHNTVLQTPGPNPSYTCGVGRGITNAPENLYSRNNILQVRTPAMPSINGGDAACDYQYDLFNGTVSGPSRAEMTGGKRGVPTYAVCSFDPATKKGSFQLAGTSLGYDQGYPVPNFSDNFRGAAPDMGAHEAGDPPMEFGVNAYLSGPGIKQPLKSSASVKNIPSLITDIIVESRRVTFFVSLENPGNFLLNMYNLKGQRIFSKNFNNLKTGIQSIKYEEKEINNFHDGVYIANLKSENYQFQKRFVILDN